MTRKTWTVWTIVLVGIFLATAAECRGADDPAKVTKDFTAAVKTGGAKGGRPYLTKASQAALDEGTLTLSPTEGDIIIGETKIQGNKATVIVTNTAQPGEQLTIFLAMEGGKWKIDMIQILKEAFAGIDIAKQMKEMQEKLRSGMAAAMETNMATLGTNGNMQAIAAQMAAAMAEAMGGPTSTTKSEEEIFLLPDMGWGDPFLNPRDRIRGEIEAEAVITGLGDEKKKIWEDALIELIVECIIGFENDLAAIVSGVRVHPGDIITGGKLRFEVKKITRNAVHLRCISEEEEFRKFSGITVKRKIPL